MPQYDGSYTRQAGTKATYAYRITYAMHGDLLHWSAIVDTGAHEKGRPYGTFEFLKSPTGEEQLQKAEELTRAAIEALRDVNE
jgi:hypothetical protein